MSVQFSSYIKYDTVKKRYQIQRKNCKLVKDSTYGKSLTALSIGTPRKATLSQLNEYYNKYGIGSHKKYKNVNVNITYDTIEEIIAAVKVFCLAHSQVPIEAMKINNTFTQNKNANKLDVETYKSFIQSVLNPKQSTTKSTFSSKPPSKKRKFSEMKETDTNNNSNNTDGDDSNYIVNIIRTVLNAVLIPLLTPIHNKIMELFSSNEKNSDMLSDIHGKICPVSNRVNSRYRTYFQMDVVDLCDKFYDREEKLKNRINKQSKTINKMKKTCNSWKCKCFRRTKALNRMREYVGKSKIVDLKVKVTHQRFRDKKIKDLIVSVQKIPIDSKEEEWEKFIWRQFNILYRKNEYFRKKAINKTFKDVIHIVNKNGRSRELSEEEAKRWVTLKVCASLSHAKYNIIHGKCIWEEYTDKKGKLCKKRKTHDDGTVASYGCSRYMMDKGMNAIIREYPEFEYKNIFKEHVYHSSLIRLLMIYLSICAVAGDMQTPFLISEQNVQKRFQNDLMNLAEGERLELDFGTFRGVDFIDGTPLKNVTFGSGTNWIFIVNDLFESGWEGAGLHAVHHAFSTAKDASTYTTDFNDTILEQEFIFLENNGIILSYVNLPIDAIIRFSPKFNGDMPLTGFLKFSIGHTGDFGQILDTVILIKDDLSFKNEAWKYNLTPKWMYKNNHCDMAKYKRHDNWRNMEYIDLPDIFTAHLEHDIHVCINDKIDDYILTHPLLNYSIHNIEHRKAVAKILESAIYNRCNKRVLWYNFEWLHGATGITSGICDLIVDDCRNTMKLDKNIIINASSHVGHSNFKRQVKSGLENVPKHKKVGFHFNGNICKCIVLSLWNYFVFIMPYSDTLREVLMVISYLLIVQHLSYVFWGALWAVSHSEISSDIILNNMETKIDEIWNGLDIFPRIQSRIPYLKRLKIEAVPQLRLHLNDPLNIHKRGGEAMSTQTMERQQSVAKKLFANHMNKSDEKKGIQTVFKYYHIRNGLGLLYGIWNVKQKSDSFHWLDEDLMGDFDTDLFEIAERVEMDPNTSITHLFDMVKNAMKTGTPPTCYVSKENINMDEEEKKDDIVEDDIEILDELQVRNVEQLSNHLVSDEYEEISDSDDDDDDYNIDNDFQ